MNEHFQTALLNSDGDLYHCFVEVPLSIANVFIDAGNKRVVCTLQGSLSYHCGLLHNGKGGYIVSVNSARRKKLGLQEGQVIDVRLETDHSEYGMPMSDELREVLDQDDQSREYFEKLTPGKQRSLIHWADGVKSSNIKIRRALVMTQHLVIHRGRVEFSLLAEEIKQANSREKRL